MGTLVGFLARLLSKKKTITKKIEKMSEEEAKGFQLGLDNLA